MRRALKLPPACIMSLPIAELTSVAQGVEDALASQSEAWAKLLKLEQWEVYGDGSAPIVNPGGVIGFASVFLLSQDDAFEVHGGVPARTEDPPTSNNRAEISAVLAALEVALKARSQSPGYPASLRIICDSQYVVQCAKGVWKKHKNRDLWRRYDQLACACRAQKIKVDYSWTRAHVGTRWNERADVLAKEAALKFTSLPTNHKQPAPLSDGLNVRAKKTSSTHCIVRLFTQKSQGKRFKGAYEIATTDQDRQGFLKIPECLTVDEAEYHTLQASLRDLIGVLKSTGLTPEAIHVQIESSRELMVKQLQGLYAVKSERLLPLYQQARQLSQRFAGVTWVMSPKATLKRLLDEKEEILVL